MKLSNKQKNLFENIKLRHSRFNKPKGKFVACQKAARNDYNALQAAGLIVWSKEYTKQRVIYWVALV